MSKRKPRWIQLPPSAIGPIWESKDKKTRAWLHRSDRPNAARIIRNKQNMIIEFKFEFYVAEEKVSSFDDHIQANVTFGKTTRRIYKISKQVNHPEIEQWQYKDILISDIVESADFPYRRTSERDQLMALSMQYALEQLRTVQGCQER